MPSFIGKFRKTNFIYLKFKVIQVWDLFEIIQINIKSTKSRFCFYFLRQTGKTQKPKSLTYQYSVQETIWLSSFDFPILFFYFPIGNWSDITKCPADMIKKIYQSFTSTNSKLKSSLNPQKQSRYFQSVTLFHKCPCFQIYGCSLHQEPRGTFSLRNFSLNFFSSLLILFFSRLRSKKIQTFFCCKQKKSRELSKTCFLIMVMLDGFSRFAGRSWNKFFRDEMLNFQGAKRYVWKFYFFCSLMKYSMENRLSQINFNTPWEWFSSQGFRETANCCWRSIFANSIIETLSTVFSVSLTPKSRLSKKKYLIIILNSIFDFTLSFVTVLHWIEYISISQVSHFLGAEYWQDDEIQEISFHTHFRL